RAPRRGPCSRSEIARGPVLLARPRPDLALHAGRGPDRLAARGLRPAAAIPLGVDVVGAELPQNALRLLVATLRADRDQDPALLEHAFVVLGLVLGHAQARERAE